MARAKRMKPARRSQAAPGRAAKTRMGEAAQSAVRARRTAVRPEPIEARRERAGRILAALRRLYPDARCELRHGSALELLVATILSAQCTDARVNATTPALFARYRSAGDYAKADPAELEDLIRQTGFFRNKAKTLIALGRALVESFEERVPEGMDELVTLPGVGRKTANVLIAEWFERPGIAVDTHVIRLSGPIWKLTGETDPVKIEHALYDLVAEKDRAFFGIATILHGRRVCSARSPDCPRCQMNTFCPSAFSAGIAGARPRPAPA